jgi:hypothetical protein
MAGLPTSARLFGAGIVRRLWSLIPGLLLGVAGVYDALVRPYLPADWQKVSLAVPLSLIVALLALGLGWAALLTFHELRIQSQSAGVAAVRVEPGATYINAPGASFTFGSAKSVRGTRIRITEPPDEQLKVWVTTDQDKGTTSR